jgi:superfamily II DNA or RNA helicase
MWIMAASKAGAGSPSATWSAPRFRPSPIGFDEIAPDRFRYLIIDEAHHAAADSYRALLAHFKPAFTLGLTATPERPDGKPVLELFATPPTACR